MNGTIPNDLSGPVSGLYTRKDWFSSGTGLELQVVETVRLDVDHWFPLMIVSGSYSPGTFSANWGTVDWIATNLAATGKGVWEGQIVRRWGDTQLIPHTSVRVHAPPHIFFPFSGSKITITFTGGAPDLSRVLEFESLYFTARLNSRCRTSSKPHPT